MSKINFKLIDQSHPYPKVEDVAEYVIARDSGLCQCCGGAGHHIHHITFRSHGGTNAPNNLMLACFKCHEKIHRCETGGDKSVPFAERVRQQVKRNDIKLRTRLA
jgi:5-methylcytosine-specific restriction endonuclease McrA